MGDVDVGAPGDLLLNVAGDAVGVVVGSLRAADLTAREDVLPISASCPVPVSKFERRKNGGKYSALDGLDLVIKKRDLLRHCAPFSLIVVFPRRESEVQLEIR